MASKKLIITTPPFSAKARSIASSRLRTLGVSARIDECDTSTGACDTARAS